MANSFEMTTVVPTFTQPLPVKAGATIQAGAFFAVDDAGRAVPATDLTASRMAGRAPAEYANTALGALDGDLTVVGERKAYICNNSTVDPVTASDILKIVYLEGNNTVRKTRSLNQPVAGLLLGFDGVFPLVQIVSGEMAAPLNIVALNVASPAILTAAQSGANYVSSITNAAFQVIQLPAAAIGLNYNFYLKASSTGGTVQIKPAAVDAIENPANIAATLVNKFIQASAPGGYNVFIQLRCISANLWTILGISGTFTREA